MKNKMKRFLGILLSLTLVPGLMSGMSLTAFAADATELAADTTTWENGDYVVPADGVTISGHITVKGTVNLTLTEGATLTANTGITLGDNAKLTVSGEGEMVVKGSNGNTNSTVAGTGKLVLKSGTLTATGGNGQSFSSGLEQTGNTGGVAINGTVIVNSGTLAATGGNGGSLNAQTINELKGGTGGAAIGGAVTINGGTVTATGGNGGSITITNYGDSNKGGTGGVAIGGAVTINGGTLKATKGDNGTLNIRHGSSNYAGTGSAGYDGTLTLGADVKLYEGTDDTGTVLDDNDSDSRVYSGEKKANMYAYGSDFAPETDKSALNNAITVAKTMYVRIKKNDDYTDIASALKAAIGTAKEVADNDKADQDAVDMATRNLTAAITTAEASLPMTTAATTTWENGTYFVPMSGATIAGHITVNGTVNLILTAGGSTLTANMGITLSEGAILNVIGNGAMVVSGSNGNTNSTVAGTGTLVLKSGTLTVTGGTGGSVGANQMNITANAGGAAINGAVTVKGGTLTATGGTGGSIGDYPINNKGGAGGAAINGAVIVNGGTVTTINGAAGGFGRGNNGSTVGAGGTSYSSTLTLGKGVKLYEGTEANEEKLLDGNDSSSREYSSEKKASMYAYGPDIPLHQHNFVSYTADGATITAICEPTTPADPYTEPDDICTLEDDTATLTIAPSDSSKAVFTGDTECFTLPAITYEKKDSTGWQSSAEPGDSDTGFYRASATIEGNTISVTYGVSVIEKGTGDGNDCSFEVPKAAGIGAKVKPALTLAKGCEVKKITVWDESNNDVSTSVSADTEGFIMPEYNVKVDVEFGMIDYKIEKSSMAYGSVTVKNASDAEVTTAHYNDPITLTITPETGFTIKTVKYNGKTITANEGVYRFTMPASNVTVSATFEGEPFGVTISDEITGGTVAVASTLEDGKAKAGSEVALTVTPATGFDFDSVTVTKTADSSAVSVTKVSDTSCKFTMPTEAVTVSAAFVGKPVTVTLNPTGDGGTASLLHDDYTAVTDEKPLTKKAGEKFILLVNREDEYDFNVKYGTDNVASMTEFTKEEYEAYIAYAKANNITVPTNTVLAWVTMPGVSENSVTLTVNFSKLQTFTVLYQPTDSNTTAVWCKFAVSSGVDGTNTDSSQMKSDATMGDGSKVYSLKVTAGFAPTGVAFAATKDAVNDVADNNMTACSTKTGISESDWTTIADSGKFCVIGGNAKTVIVAFVADADAMKAYKDNAVDAATATGGVEYRVTVVTGENAGTVKAPANTLTKTGYDFAGWRGFQGTAPNKTEKIYNAGDSISVSENTTLNAVWNLKKSTVTLNLGGGTGNSSVDPVTYGQKLPTLETPTRSGFAFDGWTVSNTVTEDGTLFAKGSPFDLGTNITADLGLTAQWKHVHSYTCYQISDFGDKLAKYQKYENVLHIAVCGCNDIKLMAHEFDENGKCACGYQKPGAATVKLNISYGQWSGGTYSEKMQGVPETAKQGQEVSIFAPAAWGSSQFSKWQYSMGDGQWADLTANAYASFLIPATMYVRALYVNPVTKPQVELSTRKYDDQTVVGGKTYTMDNILFQMNYKLPDGYTFVDAGIRLGDNAGVSYYELKQRTYTTNAGGKAMLIGAAAVTSILSGGINTVELSATDTYYEEHTKSVLTEMSAATLAKYMYESKPINVEKYDPIYWEAKAVTKGMSGSMATLPPLRFAQKDNQNHWIYGIGWLRYKDKNGNIKTIYTDALAATVNNIPGNAVTKSGS